MSQGVDFGRARWWKPRALLTIAAMLLAGALAHRFQATVCSPYEIARAEAPDGGHVAILREQSCGIGSLGETFQTVSLRAADTRAPETEIFRTDLAQPLLSWIDASRLTITVTEVGWIGRSQHQADGVAIDYVLSERLSDAQIAQRQAERDRKNMEEYLRNPSPPPQGKFGGYVLEKTQQRESVDKFKAWARVNIPGAYAAQ